jgi:Protein of unknown function (DUF2950)
MTVKDFVGGVARAVAASAVACSMLTASLTSTAQPRDWKPRTFASAEDAVRALAAAAKAGSLDEILALFGTGGEELIASSDPATSRRNRDVFTVAFAEGWRLVNQGADRKILVVGNEGWPFPVPLVHDSRAWRFDTAAGKEEVLARRIGRNELAVIEICRAYVAAQRRYAQDEHDGKRAGLYAMTFRSDPGRHNGLYWPAERGRKPSPLGDLVAQAATEGRPIAESRQSPTPFHGYYFKVLTGQGASAPGGVGSYVQDGEMSRGFALVAWPVEYDASGIMTFIVGPDGMVRQKDLGPETGAAAAAMTVYSPDASWSDVP